MKSKCTILMKEEKSVMQAFWFAFQKPSEEYILDYKLFTSFYHIISLI